MTNSDNKVGTTKPKQQTYSEGDPFKTAVEEITSSPVTKESEVKEYETQQGFAGASEREMQSLTTILDGESPEDRKAIIKALVQRQP